MIYQNTPCHGLLSVAQETRTYVRLRSNDVSRKEKHSIRCGLDTEGMVAIADYLENVAE